MADEYENTAGEEPGGDSARQPNDLASLGMKLKGWFKYDIEHVAEWRKAIARPAYRFYNNDQWDEEDLKVLRDQKRPAMTFNRIGPLVNAVVGSEINNRREVQYIPREEGDAQANELLTSAGEWFRDETGAEDEESDAFADDVICGMGWTDTRLEFEEEPDGAPLIERIDPLEMAWDCNAVKPNLIDAKRLWRIRDMAYDDAVELTGESDPAKLHAGWAKTLDTTQKSPHDQDEADKYTGTQNEYADGGYLKKKYTIVEARWLEREPYYRGSDLMNPGQVREYSEQQVKLIKKELPTFQAVKQYRKVVRRAFIGADVLGEPDSILAPPGMFGWECMTGYRDQLKRWFYGIVTVAIDPQKWSNKYFSQVMFLLNSQSKGGILAEEGAFKNDRQAEESWSKAEAITYAAKGALSGPKSKIQEKPVAQFPAGFFTLFQESKEAINQVTGLSPEFIGTREVDQAGVLEMQRRQSSLNLLASLFNSLRRYRKRQGRVMLFLIQNHLSDGRLVRIVGDEKKQYVPLTKDSVASSKYDIIVDDAPTSPNEKDRTWGIIMQMLPMVKDLMTPDMALELMTYSPLPASMVTKLKEKAAQAKAEEAATPQPPSPEEIKAQTMMQKAELDAQGKQQDLAAKQASNEMDMEMKGIDLMIKQRQAELDQMIATQKAQSELRSLAIREAQNAISRTNAAANRTSSAK